MSTALVRAREYQASLQKRLANIRERTKAESRHIVQHVSALGTGFAIGAVEARYGEGVAFGMDAPIAVAGAAGVAVLSGAAGAEAEPYLRGALDAGLGVYGYKEGFATMRERMRRAGTPLPAPRAATGS